jgi:protein SCO1/2
MMWCRKTLGIFAGLLLLAAAGLPGCKGTSAGPRVHGTQQSSSAHAQAYVVRGVIVSVDAGHGSVEMTNEDIPGVMEPMTMEYTLANPSDAGALHPGDKIQAQLKMQEDGATLDEIDILQQALLNRKPAVQYHVPQPGDAVPDFALVNQSGRRIHLSQYRGKVLLLTFIYTRCPLSDYCPLMSRNFAAIDKSLAAEPKLYASTHLLSISFDPKYDTPAVLRSYGEAYTERYTQEKFGHWEFAAPETKDLSPLLEWFGVGVTPGPGKTLQHSLSTAIVGADGKILAWYPTNDWTPEQALQVVQGALKSKNAQRQ